MTEDNIEQIKSKADFVDFIGRLAHDLATNKDSWANNDLLSFLHGVESWVEDMDGYFRNTGKVPPANLDWKFIATIFAAARVYE